MDSLDNLMRLVQNLQPAIPEGACQACLAGEHETPGVVFCSCPCHGQVLETSETSAAVQAGPLDLDSRQTSPREKFADSPEIHWGWTFISFCRSCGVRFAEHIRRTEVFNG